MGKMTELRVYYRGVCKAAHAQGAQKKAGTKNRKPLMPLTCLLLKHRYPTLRRVLSQWERFPIFLFSFPNS